MATRVRRRPPPVPKVWLLFAGWWGLSAEQARRWWQAMLASDQPQARHVRHALLYFDACPSANRRVVGHLLYETCAPTVLVTLCEALCLEGQLTRQEASALQEALLCCTNRDGQWSAPGRKGTYEQ